MFIQRTFIHKRRGCLSAEFILPQSEEFEYFHAVPAVSNLIP